MCAFQDGPARALRRSAADEALSHNKHSHPALKHLTDSQLAEASSSGGSAGASPSRRAESPLPAASSAAHSVATSSAAASRSGSHPTDQTQPTSSTDSALARTRSTKDSSGYQGDLSHEQPQSSNGRQRVSDSNRKGTQARQRRRVGRHDAMPPDEERQSSTPPRMIRHHDLSRTNDSVHDLGLLDRLVDTRTGQHEDQRVSDEFLASISKRKNGAALRAYYEKLNAILDGWREVDEILDSEFPEEVMLRFGTVEEVERFNGARKKLPWLHRNKGHRKRPTPYFDQDDDGGDSGYQEESESEHEDEQDKRGRRRQSQLARVASAAFSSFWFGTPTKSTPTRPTAIQDVESGLLEPPPTPSVTEMPPPLSRSSPSYGAVEEERSRFGKLATIRDEDSQNASPVIASEAEEGSTDSDAGPIFVARNSPRPKRADADAKGSTSNALAKVDEQLIEERQARDRSRTTSALSSSGKKQDARSLSVDKNGTHPQPGGLPERDRKRLLRHVPGREEREGERERGANFAININLAVNVLLLAGKVVAVLSSNSVSLIASLVDSALDLLSTIIIFGTSKAISYRSFHTYFKYPVGKKRFEPLGVVIFAVLMIASFAQVALESIGRLLKVYRTGHQAPGDAADLPFVGIAFMILTIVIKMFMWLLYRKSPSSGVRAVAQDAENDVVFNIASLIFPIIGSRLGWPALDPIGGICLSVYIMVEWLETLTDTVSKLTGSVGTSQDISRALYLILRFQSVNSVSAFELYHAGDDMIVEADVVLPHSLALKEAHDLGEIITYCMEGVAQIERAYIHLDYNPIGQSGHITARG